MWDIVWVLAPFGLIIFMRVPESIPRRSRRLCFCLGIFSVALLGAGSAAARADGQPAFSLSGFGTLGAVRTDSNEEEFVRDLSQPRGAGKSWNARVDSVLGVQANWRIAPQVEAVVQAVSRYRYDKTFAPELSWAFVKYEPTPSLSLRAGRLGTEFFMLADSRHVGYSYLTVRPPGDFFWHLPFYSIDGADVAMTWPLGEALLRGKLFYGQSNARLPLADRQWDIGGSPMAGGYLEFQHDAWLLRASYANIVFSSNLPINDRLSRYLGPAAPEAAAFLATDGTRSRYYSLGAVYDSGPWQLQLMLNHIEQGSNVFESSDGGYALAGYRVGQLTPYVAYSWVRSRRGENTLGNPVVAKIMGDSHADQETVMLGARWDIAGNLALKAQWDGIRGAADSIFPYRNDPPGGRWSGKMDVFSLTMDFIF